MVLSKIQTAQYRPNHQARIVGDEGLTVGDDAALRDRFDQLARSHRELRSWRATKSAETAIQTATEQLADEPVDMVGAGRTPGGSIVGIILTPKRIGVLEGPSTRWADWDQLTDPDFEGTIPYGYVAQVGFTANGVQTRLHTIVPWEFAAKLGQLTALKFVELQRLKVAEIAAQWREESSIAMQNERRPDDARRRLSGMAEPDLEYGPVDQEARAEADEFVRQQNAQLDEHEKAVLAMPLGPPAPGAKLKGRLNARLNRMSDSLDRASARMDAFNERHGFDQPSR